MKCDSERAPRIEKRYEARVCVLDSGLSVPRNRAAIPTLGASLTTHMGQRDDVMGHPAGRQGSPVRQKSIDFRELLERLLPLEVLPLADRVTVQRALRSGVSQQVEEAAMFALRELERAGAVRRVPGDVDAGGTQLRYQARDRLDVFTLELPGPLRRGPWIVYARDGLPLHIQTGVQQVQRLMRMDDPSLLADPRSANTLTSLAERLQQLGQDLLGAIAVRFVRSGDPPPPESALELDELAEVRRHPARVWYCPDASLLTGHGPGAGSVVVAGVASAEGEAHGHLEIEAAGRDAWRPEDLALVALLADSCGAVLERAVRLEKLVFIDALTSSYNRAYFDLQMDKEMARAQREQGSLALCIADIDNFKSFNTAFGYQAGNEVLTQVSQALRRGVRPFDTVARWGGEEFAVLLTAPVQSHDVAAVSERLRSLVERQIVTLEGLDRRTHRVSVTVSIGVALYPDHADNAEDLWRAANQALLMAKRPPKNQVVFFGNESLERRHKR